jgi:hypothetical protein
MEPNGKSYLSAAPYETPFAVQYVLLRIRLYAMRATLFAVSAIFVLTGCELAVLPLAPFAAVIETGQIQADISQPIEVVSSSGERLAGPFDPTQNVKGVFTTSSRTLTCSGTFTSPNGLKSAVELPIRCNNGLWGAVGIQENMGIMWKVGYRMSVSIGSNETPICSAIFNLTGEEQGPFRIKCSDIETEWTDFTRTETKEFQKAQRAGVAVVEATRSGTYQVTIWIPPAT